MSEFQFTPEEIAAYSAAREKSLAEAAQLGVLFDSAVPAKAPLNPHTVPSLPRNYDACPNPELPDSGTLRFQLTQEVLSFDPGQALKVGDVLYHLTGSKVVHPDTYTTVKNALDGLVLENIVICQTHRYWLRGRDDDTKSDSVGQRYKRMRSRTHGEATQARA